MFRISLFCSILLLLSCNPTTKSTTSVDLISELECAIFIDYSSNTGAYSEILSQIDNFGQIDAIADLERIDSLIICEWVESDKLIGTSHYTPFYVPIVNELTKTILSLEMKKNGLLTDKEKYDFALSNQYKNYINGNFSSNSECQFIKKNIVKFIQFIKYSILDKNAPEQNKAFLVSTLWTAAWGDEKTREVIAEQVIEIFKSSEYQDFDELFSCRLIYLLGETKTDLAKEYLLNTKEKENNELLRGCMISSLRNKLDVDI